MGLLGASNASGILGVGRDRWQLDMGGGFNRAGNTGPSLKQ